MGSLTREGALYGEFEPMQVFLWAFLACGDAPEKGLRIRRSKRTFARLLENANSADAVEDSKREFYQYVYAHEEAIEQFARAELRGDNDALRGVLELLDEPA